MLKGITCPSTSPVLSKGNWPHLVQVEKEFPEKLGLLEAHGTGRRKPRDSQNPDPRPCCCLTLETGRCRLYHHLHQGEFPGLSSFQAVAPESNPRRAHHPRGQENKPRASYFSLWWRALPPTEIRQFPKHTRRHRTLGRQKGGNAH